MEPLPILARRTLGYIVPVQGEEEVDLVPALIAAFLFAPWTTSSDELIGKDIRLSLLAVTKSRLHTLAFIPLHLTPCWGEGLSKCRTRVATLIHRCGAPPGTEEDSGQRTEGTFLCIAALRVWVSAQSDAGNACAATGDKISHTSARAQIMR